MLRELRTSQRKPSEGNRRWYFCNDLDLVVWFDESENPTAFQLAYDKNRGEHSISWHYEKGFRHYVVDEGNPLPGKTQTPLLYVNGAFRAAGLIDQFRSLAIELPPHVVSFVIEKLSSCPPEI